MKRILFKHPWIKVRQIRKDYIAVEETPGALLVPIMFYNGEWYVLLRKEPNPVHGFIVALVGGRIDKKDKTPKHAAVREMLEETGIQVPLKRVFPIGQFYGGKNKPAKDHIFVAWVLPNDKYKTPPTDGTKREKQSVNFWVPLDEAFDLIDNIEDPYVISAIYKAALWIERNFR